LGDLKLAIASQRPSGERNPHPNPSTPLPYGTMVSRSAGEGLKGEGQIQGARREAER
jgi:hypothetical protein